MLKIIEEILSSLGSNSLKNELFFVLEMIFFNMNLSVMKYYLWDFVHLNILTIHAEVAFI